MTIPARMPILPSPPDQYDPQYMALLINELERFIRALNNSEKITVKTVKLTNLPTSATGLSTGDLWNSAGTVKVV